MNEIGSFTSYGEYKRVLDNELQKTAEGFVKIGYLLKQARDTDILKESGYKNYIEFAEAEYSIDKTTVSRFVRINDEFSENGNSDKLREQYRGFGYAKLAIMLQLPENINQILTPDFSKSEIQLIKQEIDEEAKISDLEIMTEEEPDITKHSRTLLNKTIMTMLHEEPNKYVELHGGLRTCQGEDQQKKKIAEVFAPSEIKVDMIRIPGIGRLAVSFKGLEKEIEIVNIRSGEKEEFSWGIMLEAVSCLIQGEDDAENAWSKLYQEQFPEPPEEQKKPEVAPVQLQNPTVKKQSKVTKAKVDKPKQEEKVEPKTLHDINLEIPKPEPVENIEEEQEEEPEREQQELQIPGQDTVVNHKDWMPDKECSSVIDGEFKVIESQKVQAEIPADNKSSLYDSLKREILEDTEKIKVSVASADWEQAIICTEELKHKLETVKEMEKQKAEE